MSVTSESIEAMLAAMEGKQLRCPKCGGSEAFYIGVQYDARETLLPITGGVVFGDGDYYDPAPEQLEKFGIPRVLLLCAVPTGVDGAECGELWQPPADTVVSYQDNVVSPSTLRRNHDYMDKVQAASDDGATCDRPGCGQQVWVAITNRDAGSHVWTHNMDLDPENNAPGHRKCPNDKSYAWVSVPR